MEFKIPLRNKNGEIFAHALVDEEDYARVKIYNWYLDNNYVKSSVGRLHRFIMNAAKEDQIIDHKNGNKLDNRKSNLRFASISQNNQNKPKKEGCTSQYVGVSYCTPNKNWKCQIQDICIYFNKEEHAAYWYDHLAIIYYGHEAKINKIEKPCDFIEPIEKEKRNLPEGIYLSMNRTYKVKLQNKYIGTFKTLEKAIQVRSDKKEELQKKEEQEIFSREIIKNKNGIATIKTNKKEEILVDNDKYYELIKYTWYTSEGYVYRIDGISMHRFLTNAKENDLVDHINNIKLDNRLSNLRISTYSLNNHNKRKREGGSSKYIGVTLTKLGKYQAKISKDGKQYYLGLFNTEEAAAKAYDNKSLELYQIYAKLNF